MKIPRVARIFNRQVFILSGGIARVSKNLSRTIHAWGRGTGGAVIWNNNLNRGDSRSLIVTRWIFPKTRLSASSTTMAD